MIPRLAGRHATTPVHLAHRRCGHVAARGARAAARAHAADRRTATCSCYCRFANRAGREERCRIPFRKALRTATSPPGPTRLTARTRPGKPDIARIIVERRTLSPIGYPPERAKSHRAP